MTEKQYQITSNNTLEYFRIQQKLEQEFSAPNEIIVKLSGKKSSHIYEFSDIHFGSVATNYEELYKRRDEVLLNPGTYCILFGDELEGIKKDYLSTNVSKAGYDFQQQIERFSQEFLAPLAEKGKILAMVSDYFGHIGWSTDANTINVWRLLAKQYGINLIRNGGQVILDFGQGRTQRIKCFHDTGSCTELNPLAGLRNEMSRYPETSKVKSDASFGGHHHRIDIGCEISTRYDKPDIMGVCGTFKGTSPENPDVFATKAQGGRINDPNGINTIHYFPNKKENHIFPSVSFEHGIILRQAIDIFNKTESKNNTQELLQTIYSDLAPKPDISSFNKHASRAVRSPHDEAHITDEGEMVGEQRPHYEKLVYDIESKLPITLHFIANLRYGSSSFKEYKDDLINQEINIINKDPFATSLLLRHLVDSQVASRSDREQKLDELVDIFSKMAGDKKIIALLLSSTLRDNAWKKSRGEGNEPIMAGSYLSRSLDVPLIQNLSVLDINFNKNHYKILTADKLGHSGSKFNPTIGLKRIYDWSASQEKPDIVVGGPMHKSGWNCFYDRFNTNTNYPLLVPTGWWSQVDTFGKGNLESGGAGGQSVILMPDQKMVFPACNSEDTGIISRALTLRVGLEKLGLTQKVMGKSKNSKTFS